VRGRVAGHIHPHPTGGLVAEGVQQIDGLADGLERLGEGGEQALAG